MRVTPSVPVKANSGVRAHVPAPGKVLEGDDKPTLLREDQHYLHYITMLPKQSTGVSCRGQATPLRLLVADVCCTRVATVSVWLGL